MKPETNEKVSAGLEELKRHLDTTIVVPNQNLLLPMKRLVLHLSLSNDVLKHGVQITT